MFEATNGTIPPAWLRSMLWLGAVTANMVNQLVFVLGPATPFELTDVMSAWAAEELEWAARGARPMLPARDATNPPVGVPTFALSRGGPALVKFFKHSGSGDSSKTRPRRSPVPRRRARSTHSRALRRTDWHKDADRT